MWRSVWPLAILFLSGCAAARIEEAKSTRDQAFAVCRQIPLSRGNVFKRAECLVAARDQYINTVAPQDADIEAVVDAEQMKMAGEADAGTLSLPDYQIAMAKEGSAATSEMRGRELQDRQARAEAAATILAATPQQSAYQPYTPQPYVIPRPVTCNSMNLGGMMTTTCQ